MRGAVTFDALGRRWTMFLGTAAQCGLEEEFDKGFFAILQDAVPGGLTPADLEDPEKMAAAARDLRIGTLRSLAWHGLRKHHPAVTIGDVDDMIDDVGLQDFGAVIGRAVAAVSDRAAEEAAVPGKKPGAR